ncbi:hypothetical protein NHJ13734_009436 [Beauveria thailandica]
MFLFQVTGLTDQNSVVNFCWGLVDKDTYEGYDWLITQLEEVRRELGTSRPAVVITDDESALEKALTIV